MVDLYFSNVYFKLFEADKEYFKNTKLSKLSLASLYRRRKKTFNLSKQRPSWHSGTAWDYKRDGCGHDSYRRERVYLIFLTLIEIQSAALNSATLHPISYSARLGKNVRLLLYLSKYTYISNIKNVISCFIKDQQPARGFARLNHKII